MNDFFNDKSFFKDLDSDFKKTQRTFFGLFGVMLVVYLSVLGFGAWVIVALLQHFHII